MLSTETTPEDGVLVSFRDEMNDKEFDSIMKEGLAQAKAGQGRNLSDVTRDAKRKIQSSYKT